MVLGMSVSTFTTLHVAISLAAILCGAVVLAAMVGRRYAARWTAVFLAATVATSVTGFLFPITAFTPAILFGILSIGVLAAALVALYLRRLAGAWRAVYVLCAVLALYLNAFVAVVQAFQKLPDLHALAPTQSEPPFLAAQLVLLAVFVVCAVLAVRRFPGPAVSPAAP